MTPQTPIFQHATIPADTLRQALKHDAASRPYDWQKAYPILAQLDHMLMQRSAIILPDDCPNTAHDFYILSLLNKPLDSGLAIIQAASLGIPDAIEDLQLQRNATWLRLSPVHWQAGRDRVHLQSLNDITINESHALLKTIAPWFQEWGWHIHVAASNQWFVRSMQPFNYCAPDVKVAAIDQLEHALPFGHDLKRWQTLITEIQMAWFNHPVNVIRESGRRLAINSLWLDHMSIANQWQITDVQAWSDNQNAITTFSNTDVHQHLAQLDVALNEIFYTIEKNNHASMILLGDTWQQNISIQKPSILNRIKNSFQSQNAKQLNWLESPQFGFLGK